jgi:hypothetical protein
MFIEDIAGRCLIGYFGRSTAVVIKSRMEIMSESWFANCRLLTSVTFESSSKLQRIDEFAFSGSSLSTIQIPATVEVLYKSCFYFCRSFASVTFESNSQLQRIEEFAFRECVLRTIDIPVNLRGFCVDHHEAVP